MFGNSLYGFETTAACSCPLAACFAIKPLPMLILEHRSESVGPDYPRNELSGIGRRGAGGEYGIVLVGV